MPVSWPPSPLAPWLCVVPLPTGTSFILTLRNYVDACVQKNATCVEAKWGGDDPATLLRLRRLDPAVPLNPFERVRQELCRGRMTACNADTYVGKWGVGEGGGVHHRELPDALNHPGAFAPS